MKRSNNETSKQTCNQLMINSLMNKAVIVPPLINNKSINWAKFKIRDYISCSSPICQENREEPHTPRSRVISRRETCSPLEIKCIHKGCLHL